MHIDLNTRMLFASLTTLGVLIFTIKPAHAYIDPGTGSWVLQVIVASVLGAMFVFKTAVRNMLLGISRLLHRNQK